MRMMPGRYIGKAAPALVKKTRAKLEHVSIPSKGLALEAKSNQVDVKFAGILTNVYVDDDRLTVRAGFKKLSTCAGGAPVDTLVPYYGAPERLAAGTNNTLCDVFTGTVWKSGFTSNDWFWTSFSNLGDKEYTVMVNGSDGVWSWDGGTVPGGTVVTITKIEKTNPARCTVALADIASFHNGMTVIISGADATHLPANGAHRITNVNTVPNTFELVGVDLTGAPADQTTGTMRATLQGSFEKLAVTAPVGNTWLQPNNLHLVLAHQNRLFFADESNLAFYYLPLQQKDGPLAVFPLNAIFKRGGSIKAMATWTVDGGMGMDDQLVLFSTNGECAIYSGVDPATDFSLVGVYRSDPPMSKHCTFNYGGDLYVMLPTGVTPMTAMIKAGKDGLDTVDRSLVQIFLKHSIAHRDEVGWQLFLNPSSGRLFANMPSGGGIYDQMIRHMPKAVWSEFEDVPARFWAWIEPYVYFGDNKGNIYQMHPTYRSDVNPDGTTKAIKVDVMMAWNQFKTPAIKHFKMVLPYIVTDGFPRPKIDIMVNYNITEAGNEPEISTPGSDLATWDLAEWDKALWVGGNRNYANWTGVGRSGRVGAVRLTAKVENCSFAIAGFDVLYEEGSVFG
jgi:hypothetical protein